MGFAARRAIMRTEERNGKTLLAGQATVAVGIDLGTCFARVGFWRDGDVTIIPNDRGKLATPSCVAFTDDCVLFGDAAAEQAERNLENTVHAPQRLIGSKFENPWLQWYMKMWPDKVVRGDGDVPLIKIRSQGQDRKMRPEAIVALFLEHLKRMAEKFLGFQVTEVVISVPSRFGKYQRAGLAEACRGARLNVLEMVKAPTAAAIAYVLTNPSQGSGHMLVCDMGGSYFNFVLLATDSSGLLRERAVGSDFIDFDSSLVRFCMCDFKERHGKSVADDKVAQHRLRRACEIAKRRLSQYGQTSISVSNLCEGVDYEFSLSRGQFEDICNHDIEPMLDPVDYCLEDCGLGRSDITDIVLVGGSARIPRIRRAMREFFYGKTPREVLRPDNAGVLGAAAYAALLVGRRSSKVPQELGGLRLVQAGVGHTALTSTEVQGSGVGPGDAAGGGPTTSIGQTSTIGMHGDKSSWPVPSGEVTPKRFEEQPAPDVCPSPRPSELLAPGRGYMADDDATPAPKRPSGSSGPGPFGNPVMRLASSIGHLRSTGEPTLPDDLSARTEPSLKETRPSEHAHTIRADSPVAEARGTTKGSTSSSCSSGVDACRAPIELPAEGNMQGPPDSPVGGGLSPNRPAGGSLSFSSDFESQSRCEEQDDQKELQLVASAHVDCAASNLHLQPSSPDVPSPDAEVATPSARPTALEEQLHVEFNEFNSDERSHGLSRGLRRRVDGVPHLPFRGVARARRAPAALGSTKQHGPFNIGGPGGLEELLADTDRGLPSARRGSTRRTHVGGASAFGGIRGGSAAAPGKASGNDDAVPIWPHGFPSRAAASSVTCGAEADPNELGCLPVATCARVMDAAPNVRDVGGAGDRLSFWATCTPRLRPQHVASDAPADVEIESM